MTSLCTTSTTDANSNCTIVNSTLPLSNESQESDTKDDASNTDIVVSNNGGTLRNTSLGNGTIVIANETSTQHTDMLDTTQESLEETHVVVWVPYLGLFFFVLACVVLVVSFRNRYIRVRKRQRAQLDYLQRDIDLNRKRLHGMLRNPALNVLPRDYYRTAPNHDTVNVQVLCSCKKNVASLPVINTNLRSDVFHRTTLQPHHDRCKCCVGCSHHQCVRSTHHCDGVQHCASVVCSGGKEENLHGHKECLHCARSRHACCDIHCETCAGNIPRENHQTVNSKCRHCTHEHPGPYGSLYPSVQTLNDASERVSKFRIEEDIQIISETSRLRQSLPKSANIFANSAKALCSTGCNCEEDICKNGFEDSCTICDENSRTKASPVPSSSHKLINKVDNSTEAHHKDSAASKKGKRSAAQGSKGHATTTKETNQKGFHPSQRKDRSRSRSSSPRLDISFVNSAFVCDDVEFHGAGSALSPPSTSFQNVNSDMARTASAPPLNNSVHDHDDSSLQPGNNNARHHHTDGDTGLTLSQNATNSEDQCMNALKQTHEPSTSKNANNNQHLVLSDDIVELPLSASKADELSRKSQKEASSDRSQSAGSEGSTISGRVRKKSGFLSKFTKKRRQSPEEEEEKKDNADVYKISLNDLEHGRASVSSTSGV